MESRFSTDTLYNTAPRLRQGDLPAFLDSRLTLLGSRFVRKAKNPLKTKTGRINAILVLRAKIFGDFQQLASAISGNRYAYRSPPSWNERGATAILKSR